MPRPPLALTTLLLLLLAAPVRAEDLDAVVRLVAADGSELEGLLVSADEGAYVVRVDDEARRLERSSLRSVVFLPPTGSRPQDGIEVNPRCEWRLAAPLERVLAELARRAGRPIAVEPHLRGDVRLELEDGTWRDALRAVAATLHAGAHVEADVARVMTTMKPPFRIVVGRALPAPEPLVSMPWVATNMNALRWLASVQEPDGRWSARGPGAAPEPGDAMTTGLAVLAYLGNGHTHRFGTHKRTVAAALKWLRREAAAGPTPTSVAPNLDRAIFVSALAEAYTMSRDLTFKADAEAALVDLLRRRAPGSGWGIDVNDPPDAFNTAHGVLALKGCLAAGLEVGPEAFDDARRLLAGATDARGLTGFRAPGEGVSLTLDDPETALPLPLFTGGAVIARIFTGERRSTESLRLGSDRLLEAPPHARRHDPAYWWLATYALFQLGGEEWKRWNHDLLSATFTLQREEPPELVGSWDPAGLWGQLGGRVASTAVTFITLEIYYRYERAKKQ